MKSIALVLLFCLVLGLSSRPACAQVTDPTSLATAITQLDTDLLAIPAGPTVTDAQHQVIVADLNALALGVVPAPDPADIDSAATSLGSAAAAGNVTADSLAELNLDLAADATDPDDWTDDITDDATELLSPDDTDPSDPGTGDTSPLPVETAVPVFVTATAAPRPRRTHQSHNFVFDVESGQSPSNQFYYGAVELNTRQVDGSAQVSSVGVRAVGLPTTNPYTLTVIRKSDGAVVTLGQFRVRAVSKFIFDVNMTAATPADYDESVENLTLGKAVFGDGNPKKAVPAGFDARDVATVTLTDALGIARLSGHPGPGAYNYQIRGVVLHLYGDPSSAPTAFALAKANQTGSNVYTFYLSARHLPVSAAVTLVADGVTVSQFTTGPNGRLLITEGYHPPLFTRAGVPLSSQRLPSTVNLSQVKSLVLTDAQGNVLLGSPTP